MALTRAEVEWLMATEAPPLPSLADILHRPAWQDRAACRGMGPADEEMLTFFVEDTEPYNVDDASRHGYEVRCHVRRQRMATEVDGPRLRART